jgi:hypothetical protein
MFTKTPGPVAAVCQGAYGGPTAIRFGWGVDLMVIYVGVPAMGFKVALVRMPRGARAGRRIANQKDQRSGAQESARKPPLIS